MGDFFSPRKKLYIFLKNTSRKSKRTAQFKTRQFKKPNSVFLSPLM